jgi:hypothetical protein
MLYREIIAVCSQCHTKHVNTMCGQNAHILNVKVCWRLSKHWALKVTYHKHMSIMQRRQLHIRNLCIYVYVYIYSIKWKKYKVHSSLTFEFPSTMKSVFWSGKSLEVNGAQAEGIYITDHTGPVAGTHKESSQTMFQQKLIKWKQRCGTWTMELNRDPYLTR